MKKLSCMLVLMTTLSLVSLVSCGGETPSTESTVIEATDIKFKANGYDEGKPIYLERGETVTIAATIVPSSVIDKRVTWETSNYDISVESKSDTTCLVTAYDLGIATISAKVGNLVKTLEVECVDKILPTSISVGSKNIELEVSKQVKLDYEVLPENASNKRISYTVMPIGDSEQDMVKIKDVNGEYFIVCESGAYPGDSYEITLRSVVDSTIKNTITVEVIDLPVESMKFKNENIKISLNDPIYKMLPEFTPLETTQYFVEFSSDDPSICDIDEDGRLKPIKEGTTTIRAINKDNPDVTCETKVTVDNEVSQYVFRGVKKEVVTSMEAVTYSLMDFEKDKVAFQEWTKNKVLSEDSNSSSHISDAGWAIWMVGLDTYEDDDYEYGAESNAIVMSKINVPTNATIMQYVFRSHQTSNDYAKFRIRGIDDELKVYELSDGWKTFHRADDMYIDINIEEFKGKAITFVVEQDQKGLRKIEETDKVGVSLMFRRCLFDTPENKELITTDEEYSIIAQNEKEGI